MNIFRTHIHKSCAYRILKIAAKILQVFDLVIHYLIKSWYNLILPQIGGYCFLLNVQLQLCGWFLGVNRRSHFICSFGEHGEHAIIDIVVNEDDACGSFAYTVVDEGVGIEDLPIVEDALVGLHITAIQTTEYLFEFVVSFCLVRHDC